MKNWFNHTAMKINYLSLLLIILIFVQCSTSTQSKNENTADSTTNAGVSGLAEEVATEEQISDEAGSASLDLEEFTKHPFESDYLYVKNFLREAGIDFTIIAEDPVHSEHRIIEFDNSRIDFLDSDEQFQEELGDLICSSDIISAKFRFNQNISIGMTQEDFLSRAELIESSLEKDESTGLRYYENSIAWGEDEGYWKVTFWFNAGVLIRIQTEINPCFYDYGN